ncbi:odorant receptor Or1-like [Zophobas morio]|uniref:odorant receptor Or1-like n=1 Tax=Zophobas morio TaxID=2755281 RepID=UPI0030830C44
MGVQKKFCWTITIQPNILLLKTCGFWPEEAFKLDFYTARTVILIIIFFPVSLISQAANLFFVLDDLVALTGTIYLLLTEIMWALKMYYFVKNISLVKTLMKMLNHELFQPRDVGQVVLVQPNLDSWKTIYQMFMVTALGGNLFWAAFPLFDTANGEKRLPFLAWYPYDTSISPFYQITYVHQVLTYTYIGFTHINTDTFIAALNMYISSQFDILCDNLKNLHFSNNVKANLVKCIKHHWLILRSQTPVRMSSLNVFYLSLESFMAIVKTSWSYFALLQQVNS